MPWKIALRTCCSTSYDPTVIEYCRAYWFFLLSTSLEAPTISLVTFGGALGAAMASPPVEAQLGGPSRRETAMILHEGWVDKESKYLGRWRPRWLVLFRDRASHLPVLCTFKHARHMWDPLETPRCV